MEVSMVYIKQEGTIVKVFEDPDMEYIQEVYQEDRYTIEVVDEWKEDG